MNIIDKLAVTAAKSIRNNYPDAASEKVLFYVLSLLINTIFSFTISLIICAATGHIVEGIIVIFSYTLLRFFSGGAHMPSSLSCCLMSIFIFTLMAHIQFDFEHYWLGPILTLVSALILFKTAPQGIENISRIDKKFYPLLKLISICIVLSDLIFQSSTLAVVFLGQALFTTRLANWCFKLLERRYSSV